jgi:hypothetical protein
LQATIYSKAEYELTIKGLKEIWELSDEQISNLEKTGLSLDSAKITVQFNTKKKENTDRYAKIKFEGAGKEQLEKDIHYGLFILGTEKHESRRIDNQLRGRAGRQ